MSSSLAQLQPELRDVDFGSLTITDAMEQIARLRDQGHAVVPVRFHEEVAWMVVNYEAVSAAFMNEAELPAAGFYQHYTMPWLGRTVPSMRGDEHRAHRSYFAAPLQPARVRERITEVLVPVANSLIDAFGDRGEVDFVAAYAKRYPFRVITRLFDLPDADDEQIQRRVSDLFHFPWDPEGASKARDEMIEYLRPIARGRRKNPGKDIISYLASTEVNGRLLDEADLLDFIRFMYPAAGENTTHALSLLMYHVLADPQVKARVMNDPKDRLAAVEETLRIDPPVPLITRFTEKQVTIAGVVIPANSPVLFGIGGANRDPRQFPDPEKFSLDRGVTNHITFGRGPHFCVGAHLARAELRATLELMLERLPGLRLAEPGTVVFCGALQRGPPKLTLAFDACRPGSTSADPSHAG
jgi:cytochrome P450